MNTETTIIAAFARYMSWAWSLRECSLTFGNLDTHIWGIWADCDRNGIALFNAIDDTCRTALVQRAMEWNAQNAQNDKRKKATL